MHPCRPTRARQREAAALRVPYARVVACALVRKWNGLPARALPLHGSPPTRPCALACQLASV
eukprot:5928691-Pleurochrysis_carterae.AAC.4